jgi:predicted transposase/invertase (TIGR01784 family)
MLVTVDPRNDYAFKSVFGSQRHSRVLLHLLNAVLVPAGLRIRSVQILNPLSEIRDLDDKKLILDVKAADEYGRLYNVEMQMAPAPSFPGRFLYYWSNTYGSQLKDGEHYGLLRPVISICFLDGTLFPGREECHLRFRLLEDTAHFPFTEDLDLHVFQLPRFTKMPDELGSDLDLWLYVLNNGSGLDLTSLPYQLRVAEVEEALEAWAMLTQDRIQREIYEAREKARRDAEDWRLALERAQEQAREGFSRGQAAGHAAGQAAGQAAGVWLGRIRAYEELLHRTPQPDAELSALSADELRQLAEGLRREVLKTTPARS